LASELKLNVSIDSVKKSILLFSSSVIFALSFISPDSIGLLTFFYLTPIFYLGLKHSLSFKYGFFWGICFYSIHFYYLFILIHEKGQGEFKQFAAVFIIFYFSFFSGCWFYFSNKFSKNKGIYYKAIIWCLLTFLFIFINYNFIFWIFGSNSGYVLTHPLLPLINWNLLNFLPIIGIWLLTLILIIFSMLLTLLLINKKMTLFLFSLICFFPFFACIFIYKEKIIDKIDSNEIGFIDNSDNSNNPYDIANNIKSKILQLVKQKPNIKIILLPESAFPFALNEFEEIINWWFYELKDKKIHILLGSHRKEKGKTFNTSYHLFDSRIINYYDKTNLIFFSEYLPDSWKIIGLSKLFLNNSKEFCPGKERNTIFEIGNLKIQPCICSDLFLQKKLFKEFDFILFFMNINWFSINYIKRLLYLFIKFKELELNKLIIYVDNTTQR